MKTFTQYISEGINDPAIFKAVFMAGGPGSGKSFLAGRTALTSLGLKLINSDAVFERALAKAGLEPTPEVIASKRAQEVIRPGAKALTVKKQNAALIGRLGFIIDGTGKNYATITTQKTALNRLGYDTMMLFVNTDIETALKRNKERPRSLRDDLVKKQWNDVQKNIGKYQSLFGQDFIVLDNSEGMDLNATTLRGYRHVSKWAKKDHQNRIARDWIAYQKRARGIK
jgi:shikimate kinase